MTRVSTPNNRKSRLRRVYSVTVVAMALVAMESSRFDCLLRRLSGLSVCKSKKPQTRTAIAAMGSTAMATPKSAHTIRSDWKPLVRAPMTEVVALLFIPRSCWTCPSRSLDWSAQLDRKNPVTTSVRVVVSACTWREELIRMLEMLLQKKSTKATTATTTAVVDEKAGPKGGWILRLPSTPATTTSEMTNKRTAWLIAPMSEMKVKARIFGRSEPRWSARMTESTESVVRPRCSTAGSRWKVSSLVPVGGNVRSRANDRRAIF